MITIYYKENSFAVKMIKFILLILSLNIDILTKAHFGFEQNRRAKILFLYSICHFDVTNRVSALKKVIVRLSFVK